MSDSIVVIDDDEDCNFLIQKVLEHDGLAVSAYEKEVDALKECEREAHPLILVDYTLANGTGVDLIKQLRALPNCKDIPIILMSARDDVKEAGAEVGANDFLLKPFDPKSLASTIRAYL